jgi:hypothetical protein
MDHAMSRRIVQHLRTTPRGATDLSAWPASVADLPAGELLRHIDAVGLADAGSLMASLSPTALATVVVEAAWQDGPAGSELQATVLVDWLEVWLEEGEDFAAERLAALDDDFLTLCFADLLEIEDLEIGGLQRCGEEDDDGQWYEVAERLVFDRFQVGVRGSDGGDVLRSALVAWWDHEPDRLLWLLGRISAEDGALGSPMRAAYLRHDMAAAREQARERQGYVAMSAARAFLAMASVGELSALLSMEAYDPESARHLRRGQPDAGRQTSQPLDHAEAADLDRQLVVVDGRSSRLQERLREQAAQDPVGVERAAAELAYLANVLLAGVVDRLVSRDPQDARDHVMAICNLGLEVIEHAGGSVTPGREPGLIRPFLVAWRILGDLPWQVVTAFDRAFAAPTTQDALSAGDWRYRQAEESLDDLRAAVRGGRFDAAREAVMLLSLTFDTNACRAAIHLLAALPAFPCLLEGGDHLAGRPIARRDDLAAVARLLSRIQVKNGGRKDYPREL